MHRTITHLDKHMSVVELADGRRADTDKRVHLGLDEERDEDKDDYVQNHFGR